MAGTEGRAGCPRQAGAVARTPASEGAEAPPWVPAARSRPAPPPVSPTRPPAHRRPRPTGPPKPQAGPSPRPRPLTSRFTGGTAVSIRRERGSPAGPRDQLIHGGRGLRAGAGLRAAGGCDGGRGRLPKGGGGCRRRLIGIKISQAAFSTADWALRSAAPPLGQGEAAGAGTHLGDDVTRSRRALPPTRSAAVVTNSDEKVGGVSRFAATPNCKSQKDKFATLYSEKAKISSNCLHGLYPDGGRSRPRE